MFVTFEGAEGSGKSTALAKLEAWLVERGARVVTAREPGGTPAGERIRSILLESERLERYASLLLFQAARAQLVATVIRPALDRHAVVLCDRFTDSTLAYQGFGEGMPVEEIRTLNRLATGGLAPDLTLLLDIDPAEGLRRRNLAGNLNVIDRRGLEFHQRVREGFLRLASQEPSRWVVLDAGCSPGVVLARIIETVSPLLPRRCP